MKKTILMMSLLLSFPAFAQNKTTDNTTINIDTSTVSKISNENKSVNDILNLVHVEKKPLYIVNAVKYLKSSKGVTSIEQQQSIVCEASTQSSCMLSISNEIGYPVGVSYTNNQKSPDIHDTSKTIDEIKISFDLPNQKVKTQYFSQKQSTDSFGSLSVSSQDLNQKVFNLNDKMTNITYAITKNDNSPIDNKVLGEGKVKEDNLNEYITLSIQKYNEN